MQKLCSNLGISSWGCSCGIQNVVFVNDMQAHKTGSSASLVLIDFQVLQRNFEQPLDGEMLWLLLSPLFDENAEPRGVAE